MRAFSPIALREELIAQLPPTSSGALCVAFSGGVDSTVLLAALAQRLKADEQWRLRAVHVDHQLHPASASWAAHCGQIAQRLGVPLVTRQVNIDRKGPYGLEAAARTARYDALRGIIEPGEALLTAHHADDQLETMLLALLRGAGVRGLAGMRGSQPFGNGWHVRPLLEFGRAELERWAQAQGLAFLADPANADTRFDRNYLRREVVPLLIGRWPAAAHSAVRSGTHLREAQEMLDAIAAEDYASTCVGPCLELTALERFAPMRRRNLLRYWIRQQGAPAPTTRKLAVIEHDMWHARFDRLPCVSWDRFEMRRHDGLLYCIPAQPIVPADENLGWSGERPFDLPAGLGRLRIERGAGAGLAVTQLASGMHIRFRAGREQLRPAGDPHHRKLKKLLQGARILPWWRSRLPLVYVGGKLAAVGDLWVADEFAARGSDPSARIVWDDRPPIEAQMK